MKRHRDRNLRTLERSLGWQSWKDLPVSRWPLYALNSLTSDDKLALYKLSTSQLEELWAALTDDDANPPVISAKVAPRKT